MAENESLDVGNSGGQRWNPFHDAVRKGASVLLTAMSAVPIALTATFANDPIKQTQWKGFLRKSRLEIAPADFPVVVAALGQFLGPLAAALVTGQEFALSWHPSGPWQS